ncbi:hypothetical protein L248_0750 [Schleiferilactobacillus shenzhenensis LY-73]|uniref:Membrane protein 6-pyruvoyl-tetrahydropterin synthase-related domain-containing protein n=1 Tax=Schleiferilactobacillus shenzhenensis LY-73 TaxID=1231336 RepID=U4TS17_9LACO|nr:hypothetical protein L248_0750 [Schleiferilactobacillus shenzhenensis LY-73]
MCDTELRIVSGRGHLLIVKNKNRLMPVLLVQLLFIVLSVGYVLAMAPHGTLVARDSYDAYFHLTRIQALNGIFQSPVNFDLWNHVGNGTAMFYPWLTVLPALPLFNLFGAVHGFLVFLGLVTYATLISSYLSFRHYRKGQWAALLFSVLYTFSFIRASNVLYRWGVGEYIAMIFIPPLFVAFRDVLLEHWSAWVWVAVWFSLIVYSHVLSAVVVGVCLFLLFLGALVGHIGQWQYWRRLWQYAVAFLATAACLTVAFWGPLLEQQRYQPIQGPSPFDLSKSAHPLGSLLGQSLTIDVRSYSLGFFLVVVCVGILLTIWFTDTEGRILGGFTLFLLLFSTSVFPWAAFKDTPVSIIQYPARFLGMFSFFALAYTVRGLAQLFEHQHHVLASLGGWAAVLSVLVLFGLSARALWHTQTLIPQPWATIANDTVADHLRQFNQRDYFPANAFKHYQSIESHDVLLDGKRVKASEVFTSDHMTWRLSSKKSGQLDLPVLNYKGTQVLLDNRRTIGVESPRGTVQLTVPKGRHDVTVCGAYTAFSRVAQLISLLVAGLVLWIIKKQSQATTVETHTR